MFVVDVTNKTAHMSLTAVTSLLFTATSPRLCKQELRLTFY